MRISLICAASKNGVIGVNNGLPWHLPADLAHFKKLTLGHPILMGRKTYQSIGKPLPGRVNIIITRQADFQAAGCRVAHSLAEAVGFCREDDEMFVIGGADIYHQVLPYADKIYLTLIHADFAGDAFLFDINSTIWRETSRQDFGPDEKNKWPYSFLTFEKVR